MRDHVSRFLVVLLGWMTLASRGVSLPTPTPASATEPPVDLTLHCEGDIGSGGDFGGGGGGGGGGGSSGGVSGWGDLSLPGWLNSLKSYADELVDFAETPIQFLRVRAIPPIIGAIFGFTFDMATLIARPFDAVLGSLTLVSSSLSTATEAVTQPIGDALAISSQLVLSATAWAGPLQPFVATALTITIAYAVLIAGIRLLRAIADSVPVLSGVETFLFG